MKKSKNMFTLVFLGKKEEVYTTSEIIAERAEVQHHAVQQMISTYQKDIEEFGQVAFEMRAVKYSSFGKHLGVNKIFPRGLKSGFKRLMRKKIGTIVCSTKKWSRSAAQSI